MLEKMTLVPERGSVEYIWLCRDAWGSFGIVFKPEMHQLLLPFTLTPKP